MDQRGRQLPDRCEPRAGGRRRRDDRGCLYAFGDPQTLTEIEASPGDFDLADGTLYFTTVAADGGLWSVDADGGVPDLLRDGLFHPARVKAAGAYTRPVVAGAFVYWGGVDLIMRVPREGGTAEQLAGGDDVTWSAGVRLDATRVYWMNRNCDDDGGKCDGGSIVRARRPTHGGVPRRGEPGQPARELHALAADSPVLPRSEQLPSLVRPPPFRSSERSSTTRPPERPG